MEERSSSTGVEGAKSCFSIKSRLMVSGRVIARMFKGRRKMPFVAISDCIWKIGRVET